MMTAREIRQAFLDFFASKAHKIVPSAPLVNKDDPTLMFTNAGMNQFKDYFLGNQTPEVRRIADTQKCLRVSGKHNDLEDVGYDGTHHTMFEMLGNWSFGDYFKDEAIAWSWELLTDKLGLEKERLYATVFEGDPAAGIPADDEALEFWLRVLPKERILYGNKKDNFWEMGDTGPCGPCTEIHYDTRSDEEVAKTPGRDLVNVDGSGVVEIWNNVFIQFNRKADKSLEVLPEQHVDTGMGFERLCMVMQGKKATYDTDVFTHFIQYIEKVSGKKYTFSYERDAKSDIAMRVIVDHIRAIAFTIADGQLPSSSGAGYVIRRILRRAVRYYYSFLDIKQPFLHTLIPMLADAFADAFPELKAQQAQVARIIESEETAFLNTLEKGLKRFADLDKSSGQIKGEDAFDLYDTFGFPIDLTQLLAQEANIPVDMVGFEAALQKQKERSRADAAKVVGDWVSVNEGEVKFEGYDTLVVENTKVLKYRTVNVKNQDQYQLVLQTTPFYAESGGQAGDQGYLIVGADRVNVLDTQKENDLIIHVVDEFPANLQLPVKAVVDAELRQAVSSNHTAVHLMHAALHRILGQHATQKGQNVDNQRLRFDFNHFQKVSDEELRQIEDMVNEKIRANIPLDENRNMPIEEARNSGAMMLFGEKYGEVVRMITFDPTFSRELCGGTHVQATGQIGLFKILSEGAVAAGVRRIEAITATHAEAFVRSELRELDAIRSILKSKGEAAKAVATLQDENKELRKEIERLVAAQAFALKDGLIAKAETLNGVQFISARLSINDSAALKNLAAQIDNELGNAVIVFGAVINDKPMVMVTISKSLVEGKKLHAGNMVRELAKEIDGGGGGQANFASAGGKNTAGLDQAVAKAKELVAGA
ncbi:MAG: alanine--tRNA ligase [Haliscomenobacter sp.]|nr:alanine--tRNA ligase [Haliscomenobacter sp.]MDX2066869.1 alanine--tRNA ligase [Haliscomenobacter sp.]